MQNKEMELLALKPGIGKWANDVLMPCILLWKNKREFRVFYPALEGFGTHAILSFKRDFIVINIKQFEHFVKINMGRCGK